MKRYIALHEQQRFSIRKYSFGAASVLLGASLVFGGQALADEVTQPTSGVSPETSLQVTDTQAQLDSRAAESPAGPAVSSEVKSETPQTPLETSSATRDDGQVSSTNQAAVAKVDTASQTEDLSQASASPALQDKAVDAPSSQTQASVQTEVTPASPANQASPSQAAPAPAVTRASVATSLQAVGKDIPSSGYYTYPEKTEVKNSPSTSAPLAFYANAGDKVYYDQVLNQDGYQWLSYKSYSGIRRYANIAKLQVREVPVDEPASEVEDSASETNLPSMKRYEFDREVEVKNQPEQAAKTEFTFRKGEAVNFDKKIEADGYHWISYVAYSGTRRYVMLDPLRLSASSQSQAGQISGQISIENQSKDGFDIRISNVSDTNGILAVKVPVWTQAGDQDDLIWYDGRKQADGTYKVAVKRSDHKNEYGRYNIHLYYVETNGAMKGVAASDFELAQPKVERTGSLSFEDKSNGDFDVIVSNVSDSQGLKEVKVPVWTDKGNQDDMIWYAATKQADGTYKVAVKRSDHKNETGLYHVHLYYLENDGSLVGMAAQQHRSDIRETSNKVVGNISIENKSSNGFDVVISNVSDSKGILAVKVPVWAAKNGQDDIVWYTASNQADGSYKVKVSLSNHKYETGTYLIHLYYLEADGNLVGVAASSYDVPANQAINQAVLTSVYKGTGNYLLSAQNLPNSGAILAAVWSDTSGQDDLIWYNMNRSGSGASLQVNTQNHRGTGPYHAHVYQDLNGAMTFLASHDFQVNRSNYDTPYYNQRDGRWAGLKYGRGYLGPTGCVPTDLAMVISSLKGQTLTPNQVADYLYHQTNEFNKNFDGTSGQGILQAASHWDLVASPLSALEQVQEALAQGYHVLAAVQNNVFVSNGSHELVLQGYKNGLTHVLDPYTSSLSGWYSVSQLWQQQSHDPIDTRGIGSPFIKITDA